MLLHHLHPSIDSLRGKHQISKDDVVSITLSKIEKIQNRAIVHRLFTEIKKRFKSDQDCLDDLFDENKNKKERYY